MIHQPMGGAQGQASDIEITAREIQKAKKDRDKRNFNSSHIPFCISKGLISSFYEDAQRNISPQASRDYEITN